MPEVTVLYFAQLRERRGLEQERLATAAGTVRGLYAELSARHGLGLAERSLAVALNEALTGWDAALADGDTVAFLPPVSGG